MRPALLVLGLPALIASCQSSDYTDSSDLTGQYTVTITDGTDDCGLDSWVAGQTLQSPLTISEGTDDISAEFGAPAAPFTARLGGAVFRGNTSDGVGHFVLHGTPQFKTGDCSYRLSATFDAVRDDSQLLGTLAYHAVTNHAASCGALETCTAKQDVQGTRD